MADPALGPESRFDLQHRGAPQLHPPSAGQLESSKRRAASWMTDLSRPRASQILLCGATTLHPASELLMLSLAEVVVGEGQEG